MNIIYRYSWKSDFNVRLDGENDLNPCDNYTVNDETCNNEAISIYADLPDQICILEWIEDGVCDDACRTDDCMNDGEDCDLGIESSPNFIMRINALKSLLKYNQVVAMIFVFNLEMVGHSLHLMKHGIMSMILFVQSG